MKKILSIIFSTLLLVSLTSPAVAYEAYEGEEILGASKFEGNIEPIKDSEYDFGSVTKKWANGYFDNIHADYLDLAYGVTNLGLIIRYDFAGTPSNSDDMYITFNRGAETDVSILWDEGDDELAINHPSGTQINLTTTNIEMNAPLDLGANSLTINSIEIVGSDGEVNAGAIEDKFLRNDGNDSTSGTITATGFTTVAGTVSAEQLTSTDDADITDNLTVGDIIVDEATGVLAFSGGTSASILTTNASQNVLTIGGSGETYNENLTFDFETTENKVLIGTGTSVTSVDFGTINLETDALDLSGGNITNIGIVYGNSTYLRIGDANTTQYSLDSEDDLMVTGELEVHSNLYTGALEFSEDAGLVTAFDMAVSATPADGVVEGYTFAVDGTDILTIYSEADSAGAVDTLRIGAGTTSPDSAVEILNTSTQLRLTHTDATDYATIGVDGNGLTTITTVDGGGTAGHLTLDPDGIVQVTEVIRGTTSLWYSSPQHVEMASANPGASGATWVPADADMLQGWQLNADAETLTFDADIHSDWDESTDIEIKVIFESNIDNTGGNVGDTTDFQTVVYYKGEGEKVNKTQTLTDACVVGQIDDHEQFACTLLVNYEEGGNVVQIGDKFTFIFNLITGTSEVADVTINHIHVKYKTDQVGIEV